MQERSGDFTRLVEFAGALFFALRKKVSSKKLSAKNAAPAVCTIRSSVGWKKLTK
jgi:hypothetical protein